MALYQTRRSVLKSTDPKDEVAAFVHSLGWSKTQDIPANEVAGTDRQLVWTALDVASLNLIQDGFSGNWYYFIRDRDPEISEALASNANRHIPTWRDEELLQVFDEGGEAVVRAQMTFRLGISAPAEFNQEFFTRISSSLYDGDERVRAAATLAITYSPYPHYMDALRELSQSEPTEWVREQAHRVLQTFERYGVGES